jgi:hypothetical protein
MSAKSTLKTGRLACPPQALTTVLERQSPGSAASALEGKPDPESAVQRTLHQSLLNRSIGATTVYAHLRTHGFDIGWNWQPPTMPQAGLTLAIHHEPQGPRLGIVLRAGAGRVPFEEDLLHQGWHVLVLDPSAVVQTPQDAIDTILGVLSALAGFDLGLTVRQAADADHVYAGPNSLFRPIGLRQQANRMAGVFHTLILTAFLITCIGLGLYMVRNDGTQAAAGASPESPGMAFRARIASISLSSDGHALIALMNGRRTYVPAHALRHNPNRLHELIVAWKQGKPLTMFTTDIQNRQYGRQVGIKDLGNRPASPVAKMRHL